MSLPALAFALLAAGSEAWRVEPARPRVGDRVVATTSIAAAPGEALRLARPCDVDAAFARVEPEIAPATPDGEATLRVSMVAGAPGRFRLGPFALRAGAAGDAARGGGAREIETAPLEIEVTLEGASDRAPDFGDWRPPVRSGRGGSWWRVALVVGAGLAAWAMVGWIVQRRRRRAAASSAAPAAAAPIDWSGELERLAAAIPDEVEARRSWWRRLSDVVRGELAQRDPRDSTDRTSEELAARGGERAALLSLLARLDDGKFARASLDRNAAASAAADARARLERRP